MLIQGGLANTSTIQAAAPSEDFATISMDSLGEKDQWLGQVCGRLEEIGNLREGWDGYGSEGVPTPTLIFAAMLLVTVWAEASSLPLPSIVPMSSGAIMIEWRTDTHELTVEVNNPNDVDVLFEILATGQTNEFHVTSDFAKISDVLKLSRKSTHAAVA
jgi:hypothetical protein